MGQHSLNNTLRINILILYKVYLLLLNTEDLKAFTDFDPSLKDEERELSEAYAQALTFGTDTTERGVLKKLTERVAEEKNQCIALYKEVRYFVKRKFKNNEAVLKHFSAQSFRKARNCTPRLVLFMYELADATHKYKAPLIEAGLKEAKQSSIIEAARALEQAHIRQEVGKGERALKTEVRIKQLNSLYGFLAAFEEAAGIVFAGDLLRRKRYSLPHA